MSYYGNPQGNKVPIPIPNQQSGGMYNQMIPPNMQNPPQSSYGSNYGNIYQNPNYPPMMNPNPNPAPQVSHGPNHQQAPPNSSMYIMAQEYDFHALIIFQNIHRKASQVNQLTSAYPKTKQLSQPPKETYMLEIIVQSNISIPIEM